MSWPFRRKPVTETGAQYYIRNAAVADARTLVNFKHRAWRASYDQLKDEAFFAAAEATTAQQVKFWQSRIARGETIWLAEDLRDRLLGTIHATTHHSDPDFMAAHNLKDVTELRFFYLTDAAPQTIGEALIRQAAGDAPALTWRSGTAPRLDASLQAAGFAPLGEPVVPVDGAWAGVSRQAMVRP